MSLSSTISHYFVGMIESSIETLVDYVSFHVLLCLVPAFFIAGAMTVFIPTEAIMKYLGPTAKKRISYPSAAIAGLLLAVCSCTVIPLFVGIYKKGAGIGPAMTFFFAAPAVNILALTYTGSLIGMDIAIARAVLALGFSIVIGLSMNYLFPSTPTENVADETVKASIPRNVSPRMIISIIIISVNIFAGIMLVLLENEAILLSFYVLGLASLIATSISYKNREVTLFLWLVYSLFVGTSRFEYFENNWELFSLRISPSVSNMFVKAILVGIVAICIFIYCMKRFSHDELEEWMNETWIFVKSIFPLILLGVIAAGALKFFVPTDFVVTLVGENTVQANFIAVLFGIFMYFPTLMEVPIARAFLDLGMAKGPLLAYLLADPELSIQSILVTRKYIGDKKNMVYIVLVTILTVISGLLFGYIINEGVGLY
ncbi:MAG: permease [Candidatus Kariarchaeaceae archaeon]|jgi:uncharacterized membrane protein YraQ (UPF0718 family)